MRAPVGLITASITLFFTLGNAFVTFFFNRNEKNSNNEILAKSKLNNIQTTDLNFSKNSYISFNNQLSRYYNLEEKIRKEVGARWRKVENKNFIGYSL